MAESSDFMNVADEHELETRHDWQNRRLRQFIAIIMVITLMGGTGYGAFQFMIDTFWGADDFAAVLTAVEVPPTNTCKGVQQVNPVGSIQPTRSLCVCGQLLPEKADDEVTYYLRVKNLDEKVILREKFKEQRAGKFCQILHFDKVLSNGRYLIEISGAKQSEALAWYRLSVRISNPQA